MYIVTYGRVLHGRCVGVADAGRAGPARPAVPVSGAAQPALAGQYRDAPPVPGLPADRRVHHAEHDLHDRVVRVGCIGLSFVWNVLRSSNYGERTSADDPWGCSNSLEWATSSPPPRHNFLSLPRVRSERPAFDCTTRRWSTGCAPSRTRGAAGNPCRPPGPARTWPSEFGRPTPTTTGHLTATRPLAGRFSSRVRPPPRPPHRVAPGQGGHNVREGRAETKLGRREKERRFERHEYGVRFTGTDDPAGGGGRGHGPVPVQHPALEVPAPPRPHRGARRPGPPVDRDTTRRTGNCGSPAARRCSTSGWRCTRTG